MEKPIDLSVIIISFNTVKLTDECLASVYTSLKKSPLTAEVIVIDNDSHDGSLEMIRNKFPQVVLVAKKENLGFGKANNVGIKMARGKMILLLNSDTKIVGSAIADLYNFTLSRPHSFSGARLLNVDGSPQSSAGPYFTLPVVFAALFLRGDRTGLTRYSPTTVRQVDWVSGACIMSKRQNFLDDLLFDESIFMYMEEIDLLKRARDKGYRVYFYPGAVIYHVGAASSGSRKRPVQNIIKGFMFLYRKHHPGWKLSLVRLMLKTKAIAGYLIGTICGNQDLKETYGEAYRMV